MGRKARKTRRTREVVPTLPNPSPQLPPKQIAFLAAYSVGGMIGRAATAAGCDRNAHYYWLANDPDYPAKFLEAQAAANEVLEAEARRRAVAGTERMKFYKGEPIIDPRTGEPYIEHEYSDRLLELAMKAHLPEKYIERQKIEQTNVGGDIIPPASEALLSDPAVIAALLAAERAQESKLDNDP